MLAEGRTTDHHNDDELKGFTEPRKLSGSIDDWIRGSRRDEKATEVGEGTE